MLTKFRSMWDGHLEKVNIVKHHNEQLMLGIAHRTHSAADSAGPKPRKLQKAEFDKILSRKVIEPAERKWTTPIVTAPKQNGSLCSCVDYKEIKPCH